MNNIEPISIKFHPRAFSAFGSDLVTNDCVAIAELVKNGYDAFAQNVCVSVNYDNIEIKDDGIGMTRDTIKNAWAVIATPYKERQPIVERNGKIRRVSGNKGLGRFSAARLGRYLEIITKNEKDQYITAEIDWEKFTESESISDCKILMKVSDECSEISETGTIIRIHGLYEKWDDKKISELENSLSRLISPFESISDFNIILNYEKYAAPVQITSHDFIKHPTYSIIGNVDKFGSVSWEYKYAPKIQTVTQKKGCINWPEAKRGFDSTHLFNKLPEEVYSAGEFSFEIRAWDLDTDSIAEVSDTFKIGRRDIRNSISQYKGLSVYRDNVLVLPKSDATKDWLGVDIRRISQIGKRLSTSQIIGMVNISSELNPEIKDTTDREKLVDTTEYKQFCRIVETVIVTFEDLRYIDRSPSSDKHSEKKGLSDLISPLSTEKLVLKLEDAVNEGQNAVQLLDTVRDYASESEKALNELNNRLTYYAQTASLGSVAVVILHEILTGMTVIKRFLNRFKIKFPEADEKTLEYLEDSENWHLRLVDVANSFAPLYRKTLKNEHNNCNLLDETKKSIRLISSKKESKDIIFDCNIEEDITVGIHSGELQTILVNLFDNAVFWIQYSKNTEKRILIGSKIIDDKVILTVSDTGTGIRKEEADKIFQPGITAKPHGIGMGLVIVTELLNNHNCKTGTTVPGELGGATFVIELPYSKGQDAK
ncbi:MAG: sensor histidine kinase [Ruminococcaceae bacterium]|nr:sensor histidine kinase [Oscillospiraceae bacterium]